MKKLLVFTADDSTAHLIYHKYYKVAEAFYPLGTLLRLLGMMPMSKHPIIGLPLIYTTKSWLTAYTIFPILLLTVASYIGVDCYAAILTNPTEKITMVMYLISSGVCGCIVIAISAYKTQCYGCYFATWSRLDKFMRQDQPDQYLQRYSKILASVYIGISIFGLTASAGIYIIRLFATEHDVSSTPLLLVPLLAWSTYNVGSFTLPDLMFLFLAKAIQRRLKVIQQGLKSILLQKNNKLLLKEKLCHYRLSYHMMLEMVDETNDVLSPTLLFDCISNGLQVMLIVYGIMLPSQSPNKVWLAMKFGNGLIAVTKLAMVCFAATEVSHTVRLKYKFSSK
ncbi:hypothetical protein CHUAL_013537 [Chamberlinius hualienensis]